MENYKEIFKKHIATYQDFGNIKVLDFKNPNSNEYRIRFIFEEDYYRVHISGDLGELIATNYTNMCYEKFSDFVNDVGYFESKVDCCSRYFYYYDEDLAKETIKDYINNNDYLIDDLSLEYNYCDNNDDIIEDFLADVLADFDEREGLGTTGFMKLGEYIDDPFYEFPDCGKVDTDILDVYMLAFKLAQEQLKL